MSYLLPFMMYDIGGALPSISLVNKLERCNTFISLRLPGMPKKACQIHKSYDATASKTIEGLRVWPVYAPCHAFGQFFHTQCMQSMLPSIPGNPRRSPSARRRAVSVSLGARRYSSPNTSTIACTYFRNAIIAVLARIRTYSSTASELTPYASCRMAAVIFCKGLRPSFPVASLPYLDQVSWSSTAAAIRKNNRRDIRNLGA